MNDILNIRKHRFQPGAMSIIQMGEELIGHPSTAINELVKNGYDADALLCKVYFNYSSKKRESFAIIFDNGNGMDHTTLFGDWLRPSVSTKRKKDAQSSLYKRNLLGSKGIGRLASMALGEVVTVVTKKETDKKYNWITVNREAFREEQLLENIQFPGDQIADFITLFDDEKIAEERASYRNKNIIDFLSASNLTKFKKGTLILIESLDDSVLKILKEDFSQIELPDVTEPYKTTRFYKALATLITPLNLNAEIQKELFDKKLIENKKAISNSKNEFAIDYGINLISDQPGEKIEWLPVTPIPIQSVYDYRVYGKVSEQGTVSGFMAFQRLENEIFEEKFELTQKEIKEERDLVGQAENHKDLFADEENAKTGEYFFDIRVYDVGEKDNLEKLAKLAKVGNGSEFRRAFKQFQGLRISKNGFGVKPYGEEVEDWIELSKARVQNPGQNVNTNQIVGYIFFYSPENDALEEKTNREGFLENTAFQEVKNTVKGIFSTLGKKRYIYRLQHGLGRNPTSKHQRPDFDEYLRKLSDYNASSRIVSYTEKFIKEVTTSLDNLEESLSFSERLASLGSGIELVYHEMAQPISGLRTTKSSLDLKKKHINEDVLDRFVSDINTLQHATDILAELRKSLQPAIGRSRKKNFIPYNTFLKVCNLYKSDIEEYGVTVVADDRLKEHEVNDLEYAFWIAFLNIVNNAVYWIKQSEKPGEIRLLMEGENFIISNSGPYINEEIIDHIFEYGVTTRQEKNATGLGLAFTQSILSKNNWNISAENRKNGPAFIIKRTYHE